MLAFGLFHRSTIDTVVDGCGKNSPGSMFFGLSSESSRPGSRRAADVMGRSSMLDSDLRFAGRDGVVLADVIVLVLVGDMIVIQSTATKQRCLRA